ncbi:MAG: hypothetical protein ACLUD0_05875 [Eubacterium ramulus]
MIDKLEFCSEREYFKHGRRRIALVIAAHLSISSSSISGFFTPSLTDSLNQSSRHGTYISTAVSADFRFISSRRPDKCVHIFIQCAWATNGQYLFFRSRRSHQTDDRAHAALGQSTNWPEIQHTLFLLFPQTITINHSKFALHFSDRY